MHWKDWEQPESTYINFMTRIILLWCATRFKMNYRDWELKEKRHKGLTAWRNSVIRHVPYLPVIPCKCCESALKQAMTTSFHTLSIHQL
jgi:hypothetical protein